VPDDARKLEEQEVVRDTQVSARTAKNLSGWQAAQPERLHRLIVEVTVLKGIDQELIRLR